jgi:GTP-binding protein
MFIDRVTIRVKAGNGGDGCMSFRREKYVPRGGPDGGAGGRGGSIVVRVDPQMRTLLDLYYRKSVKAQSGKHGQGKNMTGANGADQYILVPPGTVVEDADTGEVLADLEASGAEVVAARGGSGGRGNYSFRSSRVQAPRTHTPGRPGAERRLRLTMKIIADVGLVGLPNAGKSTLLRSVSDAHPIVAPYPFSTTEPVLGIVKIDEGASFCMIDIPGLIEGAHRGKGLGIEFLRHIERCRVLILIVDAAGEMDPERAYGQLMHEMRSYGESLVEKPRLVALNKADLLAPGARPPKRGLLRTERVFRISALEKKGLRPLLAAAYRLLTADSPSSP